MKNIIRNLKLTALTFLIFLVLLELLLRIISPPSGVPFDQNEIEGPVLEPNTTYVEGWESGVKDRINSDGYHDRDYKKYKNNNITRIGFFGDSFVEALQVKTDSTFFNLYEDSLNNTECLGFGISGFGLDQSYLRFSHETLRYNLDEIVYVYYYNDIVDSYAPLKNNSYMGFVSYKDSIFRYDDSFKKSLWSERSFVIRMLDEVKDYLYLLKFIYYRYYLYSGEYENYNEFIYQDFRAPIEEMNVFSFKLDTVWLKAFNEFENDLVLWKNHAELWNKKFTVLFMPSRLEASLEGRNYLTKNGYDYELNIERIRNICSKHNIRLLNPSEYFLQKSGGKDRFYWSHLNNTGHKVLAEYLIKNYN